MLHVGMCEGEVARARGGAGVIEGGGGWDGREGGQAGERAERVGSYVSSKVFSD